MSYHTTPNIYTSLYSYIYISTYIIYLYFINITYLYFIDITHIFILDIYIHGNLVFRKRQIRRNNHNFWFKRAITVLLAKFYFFVRDETPSTRGRSEQRL